ncbi:MAG: enoyl-CoA hydratase/isomerase family protein [Myxococcales bacterium]|nr:enoyl-CoA hydratase/isomerase family protein [Myxococcales bacterium]
MSETLLLVRNEGSARILTFNRPEKRNALSVELMRDLDRALEEAAEDSGIRTVIINANGKGFSSGIDLGSLAAVGMGVEPDRFRRLVRMLQGVMNRLAVLEKPVISVIHGFCLGMALELILAGDVRIAEAGCELHIAEVRLGLIPDVGGTTRLVRVVGLPRAKELIMTGKTITAETALSWGLVNELVEPGKGLEAALRWHEEFVQGAPLAVGLAKILLDRAYDLDSASSMALEGLGQSTLYNSEDFREGVMARMQKRTPNWKNK